MNPISSAKAFELSQSLMSSGELIHEVGSMKEWVSKLKESILIK
jgi:hypothetical protein